MEERGGMANSRLASIPLPRVRNRLTVAEIAQKLGIGRVAVYRMLEKGVLPGIRVGRNWLVTRQAYERWESTCGLEQNGSVDKMRA
jgi:excisionase family DNA binding protein